MRYYAILLVVLSVSSLVLAAPICKGDVKWAKSRHCKPVDPGISPNGRHPVVVVSDVDANNQVKVATLSHNFPENTLQKPANDYADFRTQGGQGFVRVGPPKTAHTDHLKPPKFPPYTVEPDKLQLLIDHINENCPPDKQLAGVCQSKPVHSSSDHGGSSRGPSHGNPDHGGASRVEHERGKATPNTSNPRSQATGKRKRYRK